jgi:hypothetical protein
VHKVTVREGMYIETMYIETKYLDITDDVAKLTKTTYKNPLRGTYPISSSYNVIS